MEPGKPYILMLEDDADDRHITQSFFADSTYQVDLVFVMNSEDILPHLLHALAGDKALPKLIVLDKNAPVAGGMDVLKKVKSHPVFKMIPVVMISGTAFPGEIEESYRLGVNSFIVKPVTHELTGATIASFIDYWLHTVELPEMHMVKYVV